MAELVRGSSHCFVGKHQECGSVINYGTVIEAQREKGKGERGKERKWRGGGGGRAGGK